MNIKDAKKTTDPRSSTVPANFAKNHQACGVHKKRKTEEEEEWE
jgi:hypothetical protein